MKYTLLSFFISLLLAGTGTAAAQKRFVIEGHIEGADAPDRVFLFYNDPVTNRQVRDSAQVRQGHFTLAGSTAYPVYARIVYAYRGELRYATASDERKFYIDEGTIRITGWQMYSAEIRGSATEDLLQEYFNLIAPVQNSLDATRRLRQEGSRLPLFADAYMMDTLILKLERETDELSMDFVRRHTGSILAVDMLSSKMLSAPDNETVAPLFEQLSPEMQNSPAGRRLAREIRNAHRLKSGEIAPDFTAKTLRGEEITLSKYRGKWVLLVFFSPACDICHSEAQELKRMYARYRTAGLEIIAFAVESAENRSQWASAVEKLKIPYITVSDLQAWDSPIVQQYLINAVPENYLVNPDGLINSLDLYGYDLENKMQEVFF